ncbi:hypothetical protein [Streptomyces sp. SAS_270]|uniref:hypothetical protein n=1 Tax=Streptomyces sp. SAS_270 TaxID=3412748 RepID=UPI00403CB051
MKRYLWAAVAAAIVAMAVAVALALHGLRNLGADSGGDARPKADTGTECTGTRPVDSLPEADDGSPLERVVTHIDKLAHGKRYADVFTGLALDEDQHAADVWRIPSAAFDDAVCGSAVKGVTVRLHDTHVGRRTLDALADRIGDDMRRWDGTFEMREVGPDERGFVHVGVDDPDKAGPIVEKAYGEQNSRYIKVEYAEQAEAAVG